MKRISILLISLFIIISNVKVLYAQWVETQGPLGCNINSFYINGNNVFTLTSDSIYISTNKGESWEGINNGYEANNYRPRSFAAIDSNLFILTYGGVIFHSTNTGKNWIQYSDSISGIPIWDLVACGNIFFAGTNGAGVFKSTDNGVNWTPVNSGLGNLYINPLKAFGSNLLARNNNGYYLTTDNGSSWNLIASSDMGFDIVAVGDSILYANLRSGVQSGIYYSTDIGKSWIKFTNYPPMRSGINILLPKGKDLFIGVSNGIDGGVFLTTDKGKIWATLNNGLTNHSISALALNDSTLLAGTTQGGAYISNDYGKSWTETGNGIKNSYRLAIMSLAFNNNQLFAGTWGGGIFSSKDSGITWEKINNGLGIKSVISLAVQGKRLFAGTTTGSVYVSENDGESWASANEGLPDNGNRYTILPFAVNGNNVYAGFMNDTAGIYRTTNGGINWAAINNNLPPKAFQNVSSIVTIDSMVFIGGYDGVYYSTDGGEIWIADKEGLPTLSVEISSLAIIDTNIFAGTTRYGIYRSTIYGAPWEPVNNGLTISGATVNCITIVGQDLFAGFYGGGVYYSANLGENWTKVNLGLTDLRVFTIATDGTDIYLGAGGQLGHGIWHRPLSEMVTSVVGNTNNLPSNFLLYQNYPNPFNPATTINYSIPITSFVTIKVYDILGNEVSTLVNEYKRAGEYSVQFDLRQSKQHKILPSGVYLYRMLAGSFVETKKLLLLK